MKPPSITRHNTCAFFPAVLERKEPQISQLGCFVVAKNTKYTTMIFYFVRHSFLPFLSSPNVFTLAPMRGALFGKNLTFFSESVGDLKIWIPAYPKRGLLR